MFKDDNQRIAMALYTLSNKNNKIFNLLTTSDKIKYLKVVS